MSTEGDEVKDPQKTMPRAIIAALLIVTGVYVLVAIAAIGAQKWELFDGQAAGLAQILDDVTGGTGWSTVLAAGAVISIFSVTLVTMYGQTRILFAMGRDGLLPAMFAKVLRFAGHAHRAGHFGGHLEFGIVDRLDRHFPRALVADDPVAAHGFSQWARGVRTGLSAAPAGPTRSSLGTPPPAEPSSAETSPLV